MMPELPDIERFERHKVVDDIDIDGTVVPGLRGTFYRRPVNGRVESVGVYHYGEREVFRAWGYVGEPHCRFTAIRGPDGRGDPLSPAALGSGCCVPAMLSRDSRCWCRTAAS